MLQITNLSKTYPNGVQALKDVTLNISNGMFGLLGPNGAGKSTLMRTIATLQDADSGTIMFGDIDVSKQKQELRQVLGYLPQESSVFRGLTVWENLMALAEQQPLPRKAQVARCDAAEDLYAAAAVQVPGRRRAWESTGQMRNRSRAELVEF